MSALVTGDAVVLGVQPAKLPSRALALAIDMVVVWTCYLGISLVLALTTSSLDEAAAMAIAIGAFILVLVGGPIAVETLSHGRSLGKLACGLRVVRDDGGPIRFRHALVRGAMGVVEILMTVGVVACIASLVSARGRRIGDVFAGTLVIRERVPTGRGTGVPPPPPWLMGRFTELDLSGVPDDLWLAVRQYLTRMGQLDPAVSWSMAERLANEVVDRTGTPPPEGVPPAAYLAAVVNERQSRDARRTLGGGPATPGNVPPSAAGYLHEDRTESGRVVRPMETPGAGPGRTGWTWESGTDGKGASAQTEPDISGMGASSVTEAQPTSTVRGQPGATGFLPPG
ncbi:RDD family protein [Streptomyces sp. NBC_00690]|uniref:RDD family protein n=1 Tax=Streptomyces sp. NBC_00690 TaxID=2975808 RepID=UPI002E2CACEE|nr:RDD family protein [Streptomyces sp. NBC_00690]